MNNTLHHNKSPCFVQFGERWKKELPFFATSGRHQYFLFPLYSTAVSHFPTSSAIQANLSSPCPLKYLHCSKTIISGSFSLCTSVVCLVLLFSVSPSISLVMLFVYIEFAFKCLNEKVHWCVPYASNGRMEHRHLWKLFLYSWSS